jgi:hypothetical protein
LQGWVREVGMPNSTPGFCLECMVNRQMVVGAHDP